VEKPIPGYDVLNRGPEFYKLAELRHATVQNLLSMLNEVEALGDRADATGETDLAEIAYTRVLEIHNGQPSPVASFVRPLLMKMASFYWKTDQPHRAEKCWWEIFKLRDPKCKAHSIEKEVWQRLAMSLSQTSRTISKTLQSRYSDVFPPLNLETPFPPIHTIIKSEYASNALHESAHGDSFIDASSPPNIHRAITAGAGNVTEIINGASDIELATRDILSRSLLYLAAFHKQEHAGHALMARIATLSQMVQHQHMNARDLSGQTILGIAILSGCSVEFIKALIEHGSEIDPDNLLEDPLTPLQAACMTGNPEIVDIFLRHGADINRVYPGNPLPAQLAQIVGNDRIIKLIAEKTQSPYSSLAALSTQQYSLGDGNVTRTVDGNSPSPLDATMSNTLQDYDHNSSPALLSYLATESNEYPDDHDGNDIKN
jgi:ankyrin repeat protein